MKEKHLADGISLMQRFVRQQLDKCASNLSVYGRFDAHLINQSQRRHVCVRIVTRIKQRSLRGPKTIIVTIRQAMGRASLPLAFP